MMWFHFNAARDLMRRRKGPVLRMILVALVGTLWCVVGGSWTLATWRDIESDAASVEIDVLLNDAASDRDARQLSRYIASLPDVQMSRLIREQEVWNEFTTDIDVDEDLRTVVALPRIVRFSLTTVALSSSRVSSLARSISDRNPSIVTQIVWSDRFVRSVEARRRDLIMLGSSAGFLSILIFMLALIYAFRAEINAAGGDLRVGSLMGARPGWIATPHFIVSIVAGTIGTLVAVAAIALSVQQAIANLPWLSAVRLEEVGIMLGGIVLFGIIVSWWQSLSAARAALRRPHVS